MNFDYKAFGFKSLNAMFSAVGKMGVFYKKAESLPKAEFDYTQNAAENFTIGFAKESILPNDTATKTYYIAGYKENNPAKGIIDAPHLHALWLDDNSGKDPILFISVDCVGISFADTQIIRKEIMKDMSIPYLRHISIMTTHNHAGIDTMGIWGPLPRSGKDSRYMNMIRNKACKAAVRAFADSRQGKLYKGEIEVPDMQEDIRTPIVYSKTLTRLRFVPNDGTRETWLLNFASHSESLQGCNSKISADFPYYLRRKIRKETGAETFYCVGAIGGMISMLIEDEEEIRNKTCNFSLSTKAIGEKLADYALSIKNDTLIQPKISFLSQKVYFEANNIVLMLAGLVKLVASHVFRNPSPPNSLLILTEMNYFEIGDIKILTIPGELFPELAYGGYLGADESSSGMGEEFNPVPLTEIAQNEKLMIVGVCNDEIGYIVPPNDFLLHDTLPYFERAYDRFNRKHYEEQNSLGIKTAHKIADTFYEMLETVKKTKEEYGK